MKLPSKSINMLISVIALATLSVAPAKQLSSQESDAEKNAKMARRGAGFTGGTWTLSTPAVTAGVKTTNSVIIDAFFRKGLDKHLVLENSISVFKRTQVASNGDKTESWIVPQYTSVRLYPSTEPSDAFEPWISGGAGFTLGIDDRTPGPSGSTLFGSAQNGLTMVPGIGLKGGGGIEWRFSKAFGLLAGARYQYIRFFQDFGGSRTYSGLGIEAGLTYRFQY